MGALAAWLALNPVDWFIAIPRTFLKEKIAEKIF